MNIMTPFATYAPRLVYVILFLLPWQTRYIFDRLTLDGEAWEYGIGSVFLVEVLVLVAFAFGGRVVKDEHKVPVKFLWILVLTSAVSIPFAFHMYLSILALSHLIVAALLFILLLDERVHGYKALCAFMMGLVVPAVIGFFQFCLGASPASTVLGMSAQDAAKLGTSVVEAGGMRFLRAYGSFSHPNIFGGYLAIGILSAVILLLKRLCLGTLANEMRLCQRMRYCALVAVPFLSFAFVLTFSRSAWAGLLIGLLSTGILLLAKNRVAARKGLPVLVLVIGMLAVAVFIFSTPVFHRFNETLTQQEQSYTERRAQLQIFPRILNERILTGVGIGGYTLALALEEPGLPAFAYQPIHDVFFLVLAEVGMLGFFAIIIWAASVNTLNFRAIRNRSVSAMVVLSFGAVALLVALLDHYLWSLWSGLSLLAFIMAMTLRFSEE